MDEKDTVKKEEPTTPAPKGNKKLAIVAICIGVVIIGLLVALLVVTLNNKKKEEDAEKAKMEKLQAEENAKLGILPGMNKDEIQDQLNKAVADSMMNITINSEPTFENGTSEGTLSIENVKQNKYSFIVKIDLEETGQTVYKSGLIEPGYYMETAKLDVPLEKGEYRAVATFNAYDKDTNEKVGSTGAQIKIKVKN